MKLRILFVALKFLYRKFMPSVAVRVTPASIRITKHAKNIIRVCSIDVTVDYMDDTAPSSRSYSDISM